MAVGYSTADYFFKYVGMLQTECTVSVIIISGDISEIGGIFISFW